MGYARGSTTDEDLTALRDALLKLGVEDAHIYVDHGMTRTNRVRPGLREALAAVRSGDTLVDTKLDRLARSLGDARDIADEGELRRGQHPVVAAVADLVVGVEADDPEPADLALEPRAAGREDRDVVRARRGEI